MKQKDVVEALSEMKIKDLSKLYVIVGRILSNKIKVENGMREAAARSFTDRQRMANCH